MTNYRIALPDGTTVLKKSKRDGYKFASIVKGEDGKWRVKGISTERKGSETIANWWKNYNPAVTAQVVIVEKI